MPSRATSTRRRWANLSSPPRPSPVTRTASPPSSTMSAATRCSATAGPVSPMRCATPRAWLGPASPPAPAVRSSAAWTPSACKLAENGLSVVGRVGCRPRPRRADRSAYPRRRSKWFAARHPALRQPGDRRRGQRHQQSHPSCTRPTAIEGDLATAYPFQCRRPAKAAPASMRAQVPSPFTSTASVAGPVTTTPGLGVQPNSWFRGRGYLRRRLLLLRRQQRQPRRRFQGTHYAAQYGIPSDDTFIRCAGQGRRRLIVQVRPACCRRSMSTPATPTTPTARSTPRRLKCCPPSTTRNGMDAMEAHVRPHGRPVSAPLWAFSSKTASSRARRRRRLSAADPHPERRRPSSSWRPRSGRCSSRARRGRARPDRRHAGHGDRDQPRLTPFSVSAGFTYDASTTPCAWA
jgi:hypothetical protein